MADSAASNVAVCVRVRPASATAAAADPGSDEAWTVPADTSGTVVLAGAKDRSFSGFGALLETRCPAEHKADDLSRPIAQLSFPELVQTRCTVDLSQRTSCLQRSGGHSSALCLRATTQRSLRTAKQPPARRIRCKVRLITPLLRCATGRTLASSSLCRIDGKPGHHPARGPGDHGGHFRGVCVAFVRAMGSGWLHGPPHSHSPAQAGTDRVFIIKCSYLEIYNEVRRGETEATAHGPPSHWPLQTLTDLLSDSADVKLEIHESAAKVTCAP